jgi:RimJ/RimL family protein N-acetyltransferase
MTASISSERLDLIPMTPAFLRASLSQNIHEAERELQISLPEEWPEQYSELLSIRLKQLEQEPTLQSWLLRAIKLRGKGLMVGHIGFHTAPGADYLQLFSPGVELGFTVFTSFRRQGYAREAAVSLMQWARQTHNVTRFVMSIRPDNIPSQGLAEQLGFVRVGSHIDEVDGLEEVLEHRVSSDNAEPVGGANPDASELRSS